MNRLNFYYCFYCKEYLSYRAPKSTEGYHFAKIRSISVYLLQFFVKFVCDVERITTKNIALSSQ